MEKRYLNNDFEQFVKQNADQYRMFPSEKVWKGIHNRLHTRRRWYGLGLAFLLLSTGVATWIMLVNPARKQQAITSSLSVLKKNALQQPIPTSPKGQTVFHSKQNIQRDGSGQSPFPAESYTTIHTTQEVPAPITITEKSEEKFIDPAVVSESPLLVKAQKPSEGLIKTLPAKKIAAPSTDFAVSSQVPVLITSGNIIEADKKDQPVNENINKPEANILTIESVVNSYKKPLTRKKLSWQAYVTPTIGYRTLNENKTFINAARVATNGSTPAVTYLPSDLESVIKHRPDAGFQLGVSAGYPLSKKIKIISGLQFNISKYDIQAYNYSNEIAVVALNTAAGRSNTVITNTNYRIEGGFNRASWLRNFYFSASVPVGLEIKFAERGRNYFGITATAQPTYILDNRSYLVSTDYKNYVQIPSLTRKWNLNTGFEIFAGVKTGKTEWRVGPQVRYQTLSSYKNKYPIEERLFDFGLKLGLMLK